MNAKRFLTGLLTAAVVLSSMPVTALAEGGAPEAVDVVGSELRIAPQEVETYNTTDDVYELVIDTQEKLEDAIKKAEGKTTIKLADGPFRPFDAAMVKKDITFQGNGKTVIDASDILTNALETEGSNIAFIDVKIQFPEDSHRGLPGTNQVTYENCTMSGTQTLYAQTVKFTNCTFDGNSGKDIYYVWTYGAKNVTFDGCTFNTGGKAILVYNETKDGDFETNIKLKDCTFNDDNSLDTIKAAVETGSDGGNTAASNKYNFTFNNCTVNGFAVNDKGISTGSRLWGNKNSMDDKHLMVRLESGIYDFDPEKYLAEGYLAVNNGDGTYTVREKQAPVISTNINNMEFTAGSANYKAFTVTVDPKDYAEENVTYVLDFDDAEIASLQCKDDDDWKGAVKTDNGWSFGEYALKNVPGEFRVKFADDAEAGKYTFGVSLGVSGWNKTAKFNVVKKVVAAPAENEVLVLVDPTPAGEGKVEAAVEKDVIQGQLDAVTNPDNANDTLVLDVTTNSQDAKGTEVKMDSGIITELADAAEATLAIKTDTAEVAVNSSVLNTLKPADASHNVILKIEPTTVDEAPAEPQSDALAVTFVLDNGSQEEEIEVKDPGHRIDMVLTFNLKEDRENLDGLRVRYRDNTTDGYVNGAVLTGVDTDSDGLFDQVKASFTLDHLTDFYLAEEPVRTSGGGGGGSTKYTVSADKDIENGSVSVKGSAAKGSNVTITVTPDEGYELDKLTVTDKNGNEIEVKDNGDGTFTFKMPAGKVNIDATFKEAAETPVNPAEEDGAIVLTIGSTAATVDGEAVVNDVAPIIRNERTMLPIRFIAEALGAAVTWNDDTNTITVTKEGLVIEIVIGQSYATVNGVRVALDAPAFIENSRTYLPIRFVAENLGATVIWDNDTKEVIIVPGK